MSHGDAIASAPEGFVVTATSPGAPVAALEDRDRGALRRAVPSRGRAHRAWPGRSSRAFLFDVCGCRPTWTNTNIIEEAVAEIRAQVGDERVICGLSGGVDSAVAAALVHRADRRPAHVRVRRHRAAAARRGRAGRGDVPAPVPGRPRPREGGRPVPRRARRRHRARAQAQDHRRDVHPRVRGGRPRPVRRRASSCRARSTPTSSSRVAATTRRSSRTTTSAACPTT